MGLREGQGGGEEYTYSAQDFNGDCLTNVFSSTKVCMKCTYLSRNLLFMNIVDNTCLPYLTSTEPSGHSPGEPRGPWAALLH